MFYAQLLLKVDRTRPLFPCSIPLQLQRYEGTAVVAAPLPWLTPTTYPLRLSFTWCVAVLTTCRPVRRGIRQCILVEASLPCLTTLIDMLVTPEMVVPNMVRLLYTTAR